MRFYGHLATKTVNPAKATRGATTLRFMTAPLQKSVLQTQVSVFDTPVAAVWQPELAGVAIHDRVNTFFSENKAEYAMALRMRRTVGYTI